VEIWGRFEERRWRLRLREVNRLGDGPGTSSTPPSKRAGLQSMENAERRAVTMADSWMEVRARDRDQSALVGEAAGGYLRREVVM
jgi:hypothetical protein